MNIKDGLQDNNNKVRGQLVRSSKPKGNSQLKLLLLSCVILVLKLDVDNLIVRLLELNY